MPNMSSKDNWKSQSFFVTSFANKYLIYVFSSLSSVSSVSSKRNFTNAIH